MKFSIPSWKTARKYRTGKKNWIKIGQKMAEFGHGFHFTKKLLSSFFSLIFYLFIFQDLSLPIPSQEAMNNLRQSKTNPSSTASSTTSLSTVSEPNNGWLSWMWSWMSEWIYGPNISLQDCLAYFFSADELKGDNMYSCEKCKWFLYCYSIFMKTKFHFF